MNIIRSGIFLNRNNFIPVFSVHAAHAVKVPQLEMLVVIHQVQHNELLEVRLIYPKLTIPLPVPTFPIHALTSP